MSVTRMPLLLKFILRSFDKVITYFSRSSVVVSISTAIAVGIIFYVDEFSTLVSDVSDRSCFENCRLLLSCSELPPQSVKASISMRDVNEVVLAKSNRTFLPHFAWIKIVSCDSPLFD